MEDNQWVGVFKEKLWVLKQESDFILYQVFEHDNVTHTEDQYNNMLKEYFHLDLHLKQYYKEWSKRDPYFAEVSEQFYGIRILQQDVVENIFSFICSSNNNITRISSMVEKLAKFYGDKICTYNNQTYYTFPCVEKLSQDGVEQKLRENGFGYRAKYIRESAQFIMDQGGEKWLKNLKEVDYFKAKEHLIQLTGVGPKVADCICLMSLGHLNAIPVDTHIFQIASRLYLPHLLKNKTVTPKIYNEIGDHFRELYGPLAGWAHTVNSLIIRNIIN